MIVKEIDPKAKATKFQIAGINAEKQMAFYLKRAYGSSKDFFIFNDLRLEKNGDVAQIDHLIVHKFGFIIIESKSVTSKVSINEYGEWSRHYGNTVKGMPSPIKQAQRQADFLKNYLSTTKVPILKKKKLFPVSFSDFKYDILVAISDTGVIDRHTDIDGIYKADQITSIIDEVYATLTKKSRSLNPLEKIVYEFGEPTLMKLKRFLTNSHKPVNSTVLQQKEHKIDTKDDMLTINTSQNQNTRNSNISISNEIKNTLDSSKEEYKCSKCSSSNIKIVYGKYGYYFKCLDCDGNTKIPLHCVSKECKPKIRKQKNNFFIECSTCNSSTLFFTNNDE